MRTKVSTPGAVSAEREKQGGHRAGWGSSLGDPGAAPHFPGYTFVAFPCEAAVPLFEEWGNQLTR